MRKLWLLLIDLTFFAVSPFLALLIRENFETSWERAAELVPYTIVLISVAALVLVVAGSNRMIWRYTSLTDVVRLLIAITVSLLITLAVSFVLHRLDGVARSLPVIQWFLIATAMISVRTVHRLRRGVRARRNRQIPHDRQHSPVEHVLIVGLNEATVLFLRAAAQFESNRTNVVGIVGRKAGDRGRLVHNHKILGGPDELDRVMLDLDVHGIDIDRIVITEPVEKLSIKARDALLRLEKFRKVRIDYFWERLGLDIFPTQADRETVQSALNYSVGNDRARLVSMPYLVAKRLCEAAAAALLIVLLAPLIVVVALLVAVDLGSPVIFWQRRLGLTGRDFRVYKFRTMREAFDHDCSRIPDDRRTTALGQLLRSLRLDELPQLYNILIGDMSFIGPRPLLPIDQPPGSETRLSVRPGLTGWAQVNGGKGISVAEKAALDAWYMANMSLGLDVKILLRTIVMVMAGERRNEGAIRTAFMERTESFGTAKAVVSS